MKKYFKGLLVLFSIVTLMVLLMVCSVTAVTINSVKVLEPDTFYSSVANNSVVRLVVNVTGVNNTAGNTVSVTANFISLGVNCNSSAGSSTINLAKTSNDLWTGLCDVGDEAAATTFKSGQVIVIANETFGSPSVNTDLILSIYNIGVPSGNSCYRFGEGSTNFNQVTNFNDVDITLIVEANDDSSCINQGHSWDTGWLRVGKLKFNGANFAGNTASVQKLSQLSSIVTLRFAPSKTYQDTRVYVNTVLLPELDVNTFNIELYHISLMVPDDDSIVSDNDVTAEAITWIANGYESMMDENTYNLTFTVSQGFKGYNITDSVSPTAILYSPTNGLTTNSTSVIVNFTVNGTGTAVSKINFYLNNVLVAAFNSTVNTANCTARVNDNIEIDNHEVYDCLFALARGDGTYMLNVTAYDFGVSPGNSVMTNTVYNIQSGAPYLKISFPRDNGEYSGTDGSMLKMTFNVSDGNGISSCWYTLDGPVSEDDELISDCQNGLNSLQFYLESGSYDLDVSVNDTLGLTSVTSLSFEVLDATAPKILNRTVKISDDEALLTIFTDEYASCKYSASDELYTRMDEEFDDNITRHTTSFDVSDRDSDDLDITDYIYYIRCSDLSDNENDNSLAVNILDINAKVTDSEILEEEVSETVEETSETFDLGLLLAGKKILNVDDSKIPFTDILLTTNSAVDDVTIKLTVLDDSSITYPEKVYSYISVEHWSIKDSNIDDVLIKFRVSTDWLEENNFTKDEILLFRYTGEWTALNTTSGVEDDGYITYTADSPGLSLFAISKMHVDEPVIANQTLINDTDKELLNLSDSNDDVSDDKSFNWLWVIIISIIVFIIVVLFILVERNERNVPPPIFPQDKTIFGRIKRLFR